MLSCAFVILFTLAISTLTKAQRYRERQFVGSSLSAKRYLALIVIPFALFASMWVLAPYQHRFDENIANAVLGSFLFASAIGFGEEFLYRGPLWDLMHKLVRRELIVAALSTLAFTLNHAVNNGDWQRLFFVLAGGILFSTVRMIFNSFIACAILHSWWDFLWFLTNGLAIRDSGIGGYTPWSTGVPSSTQYLFASACAVFSFSFLILLKIRHQVARGPIQ